METRKEFLPVNSERKIHATAFARYTLRRFNEHRASEVTDGTASENREREAYRCNVVRKVASFRGLDGVMKKKLDTRREVIIPQPCGREKGRSNLLKDRERQREDRVHRVCALATVGALLEARQLSRNKDVSPFSILSAVTNGCFDTKI